MNWKNNCFSFIILVYTCFGCAKEETFKVKPENKEWLTQKENATVDYVDNNQISHTLSFGSLSDNLIGSSSSTFGITTNKTYSQSMYLSFSNSFYYGSMGVSAIKIAKGVKQDELSFSINDLNFHYDLEFKQLTRVYYGLNFT